MWRYIVIVLFLITPPVAASDLIGGDDAERECAAYPTIPIHVIPVFDQPSYDTSRSIAGLQGLASDIHHSIHENMTLGLTRYEPILKFEVPIKGVKFSNGLACAHVDHVDVTIGYQDVVVYVANEIPQGTCGFDEVMGHEQKHIAVNRAVLDEYLPVISSRLQDYLRLNGVFREENPDYAISLLHEKLQDIMKQTANEMTNDNEQRQRNVDTPAEYRRVSNSCHGQLQMIVRRFQQTGN